MKLLLIHTGGTIGMAPTRNGLAPVAGLVEAAVAKSLPDGVTLIKHVFNPLLDSSNVGPDHWNEILATIEAHPAVPVIVTHGTDTMSFTGAALSQALAGCKRRVVLCGSMKPLGQKGDAEDNLSLAIRTALDGSTGVVLSFANKILRADGLVKHHSSEADSFRAVPQSPLSPPVRRRFCMQRVGIITLSPALPAAAVKAMLSELDAAVLRIFGSGTVMDDPALIAVIADAVKRGTRIRAVSQCETGGLEPGSYAAGSALWKTGLENGGQETAEAALIHLWLN